MQYQKFEKYDRRHCSPVDEGWKTLTSVLNFGVLKRIQTKHSLLNFILGFLSRYTSTTHWSGGRVSPCRPVQVIWQSLPKAIREDNRRIWLQNQWPSSWVCAQAQLGRVERASTNTGCFRVGGSRCGLTWGKRATTLAISAISTLAIFSLTY